MKYKLEYSQIVRRKLKTLKLYLTEQYGEELAKTAVKRLLIEQEIYKRIRIWELICLQNMT